MPSSLTYKMLEHISKELKKCKMPPVYNSKGEPCYALRFSGTKRQYRKLMKKLCTTT
jgi:hypothetical protein